MAEMAERPPQQPQPPPQQQPQPVSISDDGTNKDAAGWEMMLEATATSRESATQVPLDPPVLHYFLLDTL